MVAKREPGRVLVIGLDGLDPEFLERHLGELPVLRNLVETGASGRLRSTIPPFSLTAWTSAMSGMNPGRTGVTCLPTDDFTDSIPPLNSRAVKVPRIWDVLSANGKKVGVVNVPLSYPPSPVNGFMISGFLTPSLDSDFTYPVSLKDELTPGYRTSFDFLQHQVAEEFFLEQLYDLTEKQFRTVEHLLANKPWDLFIYVLSGTDWIQHYYVRDPQSPGWAEAEEILLKYFRYADDFIGRLRERVGPETSIVILSDHGFGKVPSRYLYLNAWLEKEGFLAFRRSCSGSLKSLLAGHIRSLGRIPTLGFLKSRLPARLRTGFHYFTRLGREMIDWDRTRAHFSLFMQHTGYIRIDPGAGSPEERERLVGEIIAGLEVLNSSRPGDKLFSRIARREEIFSGGDISGLPEIFLTFTPQWLGQAVASGKLFQEIPLGGRSNATHRMDGVFIFSGPEVIPGKRTDLEIVDIAPTVYGLSGVPLPVGTDGRPARECFRDPDEIFPSVPRQEYKASQAASGTWGQERQEEALEKLHALGYI